MKIILVLPALLLLYSCGNDEPLESKPAPIKVAKVNPHEVLLRKVSLNDTLTPAGYSLKYAVDSTNKLVITVGGKKFRRVFHGIDLPQSGTYTYKNEWKNFIGLRNTCGTSCWTLSLLPLKKNGPVINYDYDLASDTKRDLLFGKKHPDGNEYYVVNVKTTKKAKIILKDIADQDKPGSGIESVSFVKEGIKVKWNVTSGAGKNKVKEELFRLKI